ncbi:MAG: hypothetical protein PHR77_05550 [Kiritimatiellae bacterium]|nr:hypothetical protein [Kiritimatiellia bacterium]MDD5520619.1 hypothetical protein [Kiritimatiellia bacterium]
MKFSVTRMLSVILSMIVIPFCSALSQITNVPGSLRVYAIQPACFEYMFTSVMEKPEGKQTLSFNHINGRTIFSGLGDPLGEYTVKSFNPSAERVFNPSVNSYIEKKAGSVMVKSPNGKMFTLEMGKILSLPGWTACLVWMDSGNWMYVNESDAIPAGATEIPVNSISENSLAVMVGNASRGIPFISDEEKVMLTSLWESRRKASEQVKLAENKPPQDPEPKVITQVIRHAPPLEPVEIPSSRLLEIKTPPQFFVGTEYRYPVAFETVPLIVKTSSGTMIRQAMVVPKRFQTGWIYGLNTGNNCRKVPEPRPKFFRK